MGEELIKIENNQKFDLCYSIDENTWNGKTYTIKVKRY